VSATDKVNILLVDDQPAKLLSYEVMLGELDENLLRASSASEALQLLLKHDVAVVLIDVCMPDLDGFELAAMIREHPRFEKTALIFVSAIHLTDLDHLRGYEVGAVDYVPVPVVPALLRAKVRVFSDLYRKTRMLERMNDQLELRVAERTAALEKMNAELERRVEERTQEREAALAQIHQMQKLESLGKLTGGVAHDFNNLLTVVIANLELLRKRVPPDRRIERLIEGAVAGAERGVMLTSRMLAFARRQELKPEAVDLPKLVDGMADLMRHSLGPSIEVETTFGNDLMPIQVDRSQLELAILNLALNARDAMPLGGRLAINGRGEKLRGSNPHELAPGNYVLIEVADAGTGMDETTLKRATEPFFTTKGTGKGTGLGLSMVHGFVVQSGGAIDITSAIGSGTTVQLWLPATESAALDPSDTAPRRKGKGKRAYRVLVVDDDPLVSSGTAGMLEDLGHSVLEAASGNAALELLRSEPPFDLVITDHAMPGMSGTELARQLRQTWPTLPVLLVTGYAELPNGENPGLPRLAKPYRQEELGACIVELIENGSIASNVVALDRARRA
jgi:signal transduction histidine kinase/ActR/RegA family two-component response regulator